MWSVIGVGLELSEGPSGLMLGGVKVDVVGGVSED